MGHQKLDGNVENRHMTKITGKGGGGQALERCQSKQSMASIQFAGEKKDRPIKSSENTHQTGNTGKVM